MKNKTLIYVLIGLAIGIALYFILRKPQAEEQFSGGYVSTGGTLPTTSYNPTNITPIQAPGSIGTRS